MYTLKQITKLTSKSFDLLIMAEQSQKKYESMLKYNIEVAEPNDFKPFSDEVIEFQDKVTKRIMASYFRVINEIKAFEL
jgi:hypothetical protein